MSTINILHLSDLHYDSKKPDDIKIVLDALWKDLRKLEEEENLHPDVAVFSGDLVSKGDNEQDYSAVKTAFIEPLLSTLRLTKDYLFLTPGNHDIQQAKIDKYLQLGLAEGLTNQNEVNAFLDSLSPSHQSLDRLANFLKFREQTDSQFKNSSDGLFATYSFPLKGLTVGIACLNSSWRATGAPNNADYGKLLVGERQVDKAGELIKGADLRLAVLHHPFEWLALFERRQIRRRVFSQFDLLLFGHNHEPEPVLVENPDNAVIISNGGCMYQSRQYYNGYTVVTWDTDKQQVCTHLRTYFDGRRTFDKAVNDCADGKKTFALPKSSLTPGSLLLPTTIDEVGGQIIERSNQHLLSATTDSIAPKDLREIFVEPPLCSEPEQKIKAESGAEEKNLSPATYFTIDDLLATDDNYLLIGKKESGTTTLLNYISIKIIESDDLASRRFPFYINYSDLGKGKNMIQRAMLASTYGNHSAIDIEEYLKQGKCTLLLDDFTFEQGRTLEQLTALLGNIQTINSFSLQKQVSIPRWT